MLLASFWKRDFLELRNGLFFTLCKSLSQSMSFLLFKPVPQRKQDIKKSLFPQADIYSLFFSYVSWHYVVQLFLVCKMCEIFHHFLLSSTKIACATDEIKFLLRPSGKQGQNPCFWPPAVYQDLSIAQWFACYISHCQIVNQVKGKIWNIFLFMGRHPSLINTSPGYEELHIAAMGFEAVRNREIFWI